MAWATANMADVRQEVIRRLYVFEDVINDTASGGDTTSIISAGGTDGVHLESAYYSGSEFVGAWVYVPGVAAPVSARVTSYDRDDGDLTISPALGATASGEAYEIHYLLPAERLNQWIQDRAREISRDGITTIAEATSVNIDKYTLAEGVLADALRYLANRETGQARDILLAQADEHEYMHVQMAETFGFNTLNNRLRLVSEDNIENSVLRRR